MNNNFEIEQIKEKIEIELNSVIDNTTGKLEKESNIEERKKMIEEELKKIKEDLNKLEIEIEIDSRKSNEIEQILKVIEEQRTTKNITGTIGAVSLGTTLALSGILPMVVVMGIAGVAAASTFTGLFMKTISESQRNKKFNKLVEDIVNEQKK